MNLPSRTFKILIALLFLASAACLEKPETEETTDSSSVPQELKIQGSITIAPDTCTKYTVSLIDNSRALIEAPEDIAVSLRGLGDSAIFSDAQCITPISATTIASTKNSSSFYVTLSSNGVYTVLAEEIAQKYSLESGAWTIVVQDGTTPPPADDDDEDPANPPTQLMLSGPASAISGQCVAMIAGTLDVNSVAAVVSGLTVVSLSSTGSGGFFSNATCTNSISNTQIDFGTSSSSIFYFKNTTIGAQTVTATAIGLTSANHNVNIQLGVPTKLAMFGLSTIDVEQCAAYSVRTTDNLGNDSPVSSNTTVMFSNTAAGSFYSDAACTASITNTSISSGSSSQLIYFKNSSAQTANVNIDDLGSLTGMVFPIATTTNPPNELNFNGPASALAGQCTVFTVSARFGGVNSPVASNTMVSLTGAGNGNFYSSAACTAGSEISAIQISMGQHSSPAFYFKNTSAEALGLQATHASLTGDTHPFTVNAAVPNKISLAGPLAIGIGQCSAYVVQSQDTFNNPSNVSSDTTVNFTGVANGSFYSDAACSTGISNTLISSGTNQATVYFKNNTAETANVMADDAGSLAASNLSITAQPSPPTKLSLAGAAGSNAGACTAFSVSAQTAASVNSPVSSNITVNLSGFGNGDFYSNAACTGGNEITSIQIASGQHTSNTFYFKDNVAESLTLTASFAGLTASNLAHTVNAGTPTKLVLQGAPSLPIGQCQAYTVGTQDALNNPSNVAANTTVNFTGVANGSFYSDSVCTVAITSTTVASGSNLTTVYFKNDTPETANIVADDTGGLSAANLSITSQTSPPTKLVLAGAAGSAAGGCTTFTVSTQNASSVNSAVASNIMVNLSGFGNGDFYSDSSCTGGNEITSIQISSGQHTSNNFYFKDTVAESLTLSASFAGLTASNLAHTVSAGAPSKLALQGAPSLQVGQCLAYTVETQDAFNNPSNVGSNTTINFTGAANGSFYSDSGCGSAISNSSITSGSSQKTVYFKNNTIETANTVVDDPGALTAGNLSITTQANPPTKLVLAGAGSSNAGSCSSFTVSTQDASSVNSPVSSNIAVNLTGVGNGDFYSDASCTGGNEIASIQITSGQHTSATFYFKDNTAEALTLTASFAGLTASNLAHTVNPGAPNKIALQGAPSLQVGQCLAYTVEIQDSLSNPSNVGANTTVNFTGVASGSFYSDSGCSSAVASTVVSSGTNQKTVYFKNDAAETANVTADDPGALTAGNLSITSQPSPPTKLKLAGAATSSAGACSTFTVSTQDAANVNSPVGSNIMVNLTGVGNGDFYSDASCTGGNEIASIQISSGQHTSANFYFKDTVAEALTLTASFAGLTSSNVAHTVNAGTPTKLTLQGAPALQAGQCLAYAVEVQDSFDNPSNVGSNTTINFTGAANGSFYSDSGCTSAISSSSITSGSSQKTVYFKNSTIETANTSVDDPGSLAAANLAITTLANIPSKLAINAAASSTVGSCVAVVVKSKDNIDVDAPVASNITVALSGDGNGSFYSNAACTGGNEITSIQISSGQSSSATFYFKDSIAEALTWQATNAGLTAASHAHTVNPGSPSKILLTGPTSIGTGQCVAYSVQSADTLDNPSNVGANTTVNFTGQANGSFFSDSGCTSVTTSTIINSGSNTKTIYYKNSTAQTANLVADDTGALTAANLSVTSNVGLPDHLAVIGPASALYDTCVTLTVQSQDSSNNPSNVTSNSIINLAGQGLGNYYSNAGCSAAISSFTLNAGSNTGTVYFKTANPGNYTLGASTAGLTSGALAITINPGTPTKLVLTGNTTIDTNACMAYTLSVQDADNNLAPVATNTTMTLGGAGAGSFFSDAACGSAISTSLYTAGTSSKTIYYKNSSAQSVTLTANDGGALTDASLGVTVTVPSGGGGGGGGGGGLPPPEINFSITSVVVDESKGSAYVTVNLNQVLTIDVTADYAVSGTAISPQDHNLVSGGITIPAGQTSTVINYLVYDDPLVEADETFTITLSNVANAGLGSGGATTITIRDNDTPGTDLPVDNIVKKIALGQYHTCAVVGDALYCWGLNDYNQLGSTQTPAGRNFPQKVVGMESGVTDVAAGYRHTCAVHNGTLKCWGYNGHGELGDGTTTNRSSPVEVVGLQGKKITSVSAGAGSNYNTCAVADGAAYCWGYNQHGQIGDGTTTQRLTPVQVSGLSSGVTKISTSAYFGYNHTCAIHNGAAKCWGYGGYGNLGDGNASTMYSPVQVVGLTEGVTDISVGYIGTCAVHQGAAKCWGYNAQGQIGDGTTTQRNSPTQVTGLTSGVTDVFQGNYAACAIHNGAMKCWGYNANGQLGDGTTTNRSTPVAVSGMGSGVQLLADSGSYDSQNNCAVKDYHIYCWGLNNNGQSGDGSFVAKYTPVRMNGIQYRDSDSKLTVTKLVSNYRTCAIYSDGSLKCWGLNDNGELGLGHTSSVYAPTQVPGMESGVTDVVFNYDSTYAIKNGALYAWGYNGYGNIGDGTTTQRLTPTLVPGMTSGVTKVATTEISTYQHVCAIKDGGVWCWGYGGYGQLGNSASASSNSPVQVTGLTSGATDIAVIQSDGNYANSSCAIVNGGVKCWGYDGYGQLGNGAPLTTVNAPVDVTGMGAGSGVTSLVSGTHHHICAIQNGAAKCWGYNGYGNLGDGTTTNQPSPVQVSGLTSGVTKIQPTYSNDGYGWGCALKDGGLWCWGYNGYGNLGDGTTTQRTTPVQVTGLTSGVVDFELDGGMYGQGCALTSAGAMRCWGYSGYGSMGDGLNTQQNNPVQVTGLTSGVSLIAKRMNYNPAYQNCAVHNGDVRCWGYNTYGQAGDGWGTGGSVNATPMRAIEYWPHTNPLDSGVHLIAAGSSHTCAIVNEGARCWGANDQGQLGDGTFTDRTTPVAVSGLTTGITKITAGNDFTCAIHNGASKCWGDNSFGQLGDGTTTTRNTAVTTSGLGSAVTDLSAGTSHTCAVHGGFVKCWGDNSFGQLGNGTTTSSMTPVSTSIPSGVQVVSGNRFSCAQSGGGIKCWGSNSAGQLGDNTTNTRLSPVDVIGMTSSIGKISAGSDHVCAIKSRQAYCWGFNGNGQLGDGTTATRKTPILVTDMNEKVDDLVAGGTHTCAIKDENPYCWGNNAQGQLGVGSSPNLLYPELITGHTGVVRLSAGLSHTCLSYQTKSYCWGANGGGQLGDGTTLNSSLPEQVSY